MNIPKLIIFYGPPGSGKGTQAELLQSTYDAVFFDAGHEFRSFVDKYKGELNSPEQFRAKRIHDMMLQGVPILTEDFLYIVQKKVEDVCLTGENVLIMDKPGGVLIPEAQWLNDLILKKGISTVFIHLSLSLETAIQRATNRYYVPDSKKPYKTYEDALRDCSDGQKPMQRLDDQDSTAVQRRYKTLYQDNKESILNIFKSNNFVKTVTLDASLDINIINESVKKFISTNS